MAASAGGIGPAGGGAEHVASARDGIGQLDLLRYLTRVRIIPVVEIDAVSHARPLAHVLADAGLTCVEITFRTAAAGDAIAAIAAEIPDVVVGAGTVRTVEQADEAVTAGATFLVAPGLNPAVAVRAHTLGVPLMPGVCTPTEIEQAVGMGLNLLKFFPAEAAGGVAYLKALAGPFRDVRFVPTGGIGPGNVSAYLKLPLVAACAGSWMVPPPLIAAGDLGAIGRLACEAAELVRIHRQQGP